MSFPAYPSYKVSGVEWLGEVPSHWIVQRFKNAVGVARNGLWGEEAQGDENDIICVRVADFDRSAFRVNLTNPTIRSIAAKDREGRVLCNGDLLLEKSGGGEKQPVGAVVLYDHDHPAICSNFVARIVLALGMHPRFWCYVHASAYALRITVGSINQTSGIQNLDQSRYFEEQAPFPPSHEQTAIAAFLDRETAKIDALVEEQRRLITLLKEKRQAVISHAVTKGLNPTAPMKDSGIEWLGEVPSHWDARSISSISTKITNGYVGPTRDILAERGVRYLQSLHIKQNKIIFDREYYVSETWSNEHSKSILKIGDVLLVQTGDIGQCAVVTNAFAGCNCHALIIVSPVENVVCGTWLSWVLNSDYGQQNLFSIQTGALHPHLNCGNVKSITIPLPPIPEQLKIVDFIERRLSRYGDLIEEAEQAIVLLAERRSGLISAAVTGKIDVRDSVRVLQFPVNRARARGLIATEIIERSAHQATFGRVKLQKVAYLADAHVGVSELEGAYVREAAGPLDREMIREMEREASALTGIQAEQPHGAGSAVAYRLGDRPGAHRQELDALLGERAAKLDKLIKDIATIDTKGAEAVATLYAVWNDALIDGEMPADMEIVLAVLSEWHPEKAKKFRIDELQTWLGWMRRHDLVPRGTEPKTSTGRLFA